MRPARSSPVSLAGMPIVTMLQPTQTHELHALRSLFVDYASALKIDLGFQDFEGELARLPGDYAEPRGKLLLALVETSTGHERAAPWLPAQDAVHRLLLGGNRQAWVAGCCALRPLDTVDFPNAAEMKRLYIRPAFRGLGLGRQLAEAILDAARHAGYACVLLDTLDDMESARALYEDLGFESVPPYYHNPIAGSHYLKVDL